ncbi:MAG: hypothetical protein IID31_02620 [Planctomycetes bacterium]|nr:hypothetical protein [Planctomycetota bacterium]
MTFARRAVWMVGVVLLTAPALAQSPDPGQVLAQLRAKHPGVRVLEHTGLVRVVCAQPMTSAATPRQAADDWLRQYVGVFGAGAPELALESSRRISGGKHALTYRQHVGGLPIEGSRVKLVIHEQSVSRVVYVCAKVAAVPPGGFGPPTVASAAALAAARTHPSAAALPNWQAPELIVVFADPTLREIDGALAWKCVGSGGPMGRSAAVYVDAFSGHVLRMVELTLFSGPDITGTVTGNATPGTEPDIGGTGPPPAGCDNLPQNALLPFLLVEALDGGGTVLDQTHTAADGSYALTAPGAGTVRASLIGRSWKVVDCDISGCPLPPPLSKSVPPFVRDFQFNASTTVGKTAQVNGFLNVARTWDYFKTRIANKGELNGLDEEIDVVVNAGGGDCSGRYDPKGPNGHQILFSSASQVGGPCVNMAFSTVVSHEYGHYLADVMLEIDPLQAAFTEGFSDTLAHLVHDTELIGENYKGCCTVFRDPLNTSPPACRNNLGNRQYPDCGVQIHPQGMILSGIWLDLLRNMRATYGSQGLELTRQLHVDWCFITAGERPAPDECPNFPQVADAGTLIEVLTADDDDVGFANGTPHCHEILDAFAKHNIAVDPADIGLGCIDGGDSVPAGGRACYADLDTSTGPGVLDIFDFIAFQRLFVQRDPAACDCDKSSGPVVCDIFDFLCFQSAFVAGCP